MRQVGRWIVIGALGLGGFVGTARAHQGKHAEGTLNMSDLPSSVRSTFEKESKGGEVEGLRKATKNGKTVYEGEVVQNGKGTDLEVSENGKVLDRSKAHDEATEHEKTR